MLVISDLKKPSRLSFVNAQGITTFADKKEIVSQLRSLECTGGEIRFAKSNLQRDATEPKIAPANAKTGKLNTESPARPR